MYLLLKINGQQVCTHTLLAFFVAECVLSRVTGNSDSHLILLLGKTEIGK